MKAADKEQLERIIASLDETGLVALSNKGLVRRAQKDLEGASVTVEETEQFLIVRGADWTVYMPPGGPKSARDDTKATGITRQILSATMYLRDTWFTQGEAEPSGSQTGDSAANTAALASSPETGGDQAYSVQSQAPADSKATAQTTDQTADRNDKARATASDGSTQVREPAALADTSARTKDKSVPASKSAGKNSATKSPEGEALKEALLNLSMQELTKWAGKNLYREIAAILQHPVELEVECAVGLILRLSQHDIEVRLLPSKERGTKLLEQLLSTGPKALHKRWALMAVMALHKKTGKTIPGTTETATDPAVARHQHAILLSTQQLLESVLSMGIAHPSSRVIERLFTLSVSATAMQLPRLGHLLRALSSEVASLNSREASADTRRLFEGMSQAYALTRALQNADQAQYKALAGSARTQYDPAGDLNLSGVGAYPWRTNSGFEGVTALFWDNSNQRFLTWSASRRTNTMGFSLEQTYTSESPWAQGPSLEKLCRAQFTLNSAKTNAVGRLSSAQQCSVGQLSESVCQAKIDFGSKLFKNWSVLRQYIVQQLPIGLHLRNPMDRIIVLEPQQWGDRFFDEMQQSFCWLLADDGEQQLALTLPWTSTTEDAIECLEALKPERDNLVRVLARIVFTGTASVIEPISFFSAGSSLGFFLMNPAFDRRLLTSRQSTLLERLRAKYGTNKITTSMTADDDWDDMVQTDSSGKSVPPAIQGVLSRSEELLLRLAESGSRNLPEKTKQQVQEVAGRLSSCGLLELGKSFDVLARQQQLQAGIVLQSDYLCRLHRQALAGISNS